MTKEKSELQAVPKFIHKTQSVVLNQIQFGSILNIYAYYNIL